MAIFKSVEELNLGPPNTYFLVDFSMHYLHRNIYYTHSQQQQITDTHYSSVSTAIQLFKYLRKLVVHDAMRNQRFKDVRAQKLPRTDFFKTLTAGRK